MKLLVLLLICFLAAVYAEPAEQIVIKFVPGRNSTEPPDMTKALNVPVSSFVVGGDPAPRGVFPYYARIHLYVPGGYFIFCGSSLISVKHLLSAKHCIPDNLQGIDVYLGMTNWVWGESNSNVPSVSWYASRTEKTSSYFDIAIFGLKKAVEVSDRVAPVFLPRASQAKDFFVGQEGRVAGWGGQNLFNGALQYIPVRFASSSSCGVAVGTICASGRDSTSQTAVGGDSGGPIVLLEGDRHVLVGCLSYTYGNHIGGTHIPQYLDWISQVTGLMVYN